MREKELFDIIITSLETEPQDWVLSLSRCTLDNGHLGVELWVVNTGWSYLLFGMNSPYIYKPIEYRFSLWNTIKLWRVVNSMLKQRMKKSKARDYIAEVIQPSNWTN